MNNTIEILKVFLAMYLVFSIVTSLMLVVINNKSLGKMKWWQIVLLFILLPILTIRETLKKESTNGKDLH